MLRPLVNLRKFKAYLTQSFNLLDDKTNQR